MCMKEFSNARQENVSCTTTKIVMWVVVSLVQYAESKRGIFSIFAYMNG